MTYTTTQLVLAVEARDIRSDFFHHSTHDYEIFRINEPLHSSIYVPLMLNTLSVYKVLSLARSHQVSSSPDLLLVL